MDACRNCRLETVDDEACPLCEGVHQFQTLGHLEQALRSWAMRERGSVENEDAFRAFLEATLTVPDVEALFSAYRARATLERLCDPFDRAQGGAASVGPRSERAPTTDRVPVVPLLTSALVETQLQSMPPRPVVVAPAEATGTVNAPSRAVLYPLASVAASDGVMELDERWFLDECLKRYGVAPTADHEIRIYHPLDYAALVPVEVREALLDDMCRLAMIDGLPDAAEARMIYAYCSEWRIPEERARNRLIEMQNENISLARRLWLGFRNYVLPGRWENTKL